ncbi:MAG TPA: peptidylprolyl isomerase [Chthoniobacteraceae bacterium]|jgi:cyclophilin family peptidyl-prolyl cis-trans isomerase|nr:peptidylprolyl isomerase [Chthoniobacteraceae bacterium]
MKKNILLLLCLLALGSPALRAQNSAVFVFRIDHEKPLAPVVIALDGDAAPATVANFEKLVRHHFYNHLKVHRVIPNTLVQMGDPLSRWSDRSRVGTGGPGYTLPPEIKLRHTAGAVAMARLPDALNPARRSGGSQFYICLKPMPQLDGQYTVFGHVTQGMATLETISGQEADSNNDPVTPVVIESATMGAKPPKPLLNLNLHLRWPW